LNANGSWKKAPVVQLQECHVSVSNKNQKPQVALCNNDAKHGEKADSLLGARNALTAERAPVGRPLNNTAWCASGRRTFAPLEISFRAAYSRLSTVACDFVQFYCATNQTYWNVVSLNTHTFTPTRATGR